MKLVRIEYANKKIFLPSGRRVQISDDTKYIKEERLYRLSCRFGFLYLLKKGNDQN